MNLKFSLQQSITVTVMLILTYIGSVIATPSLNDMRVSKVLEQVVPEQIGTWKYKPSPYAQVSVSNIAQKISDAIYDQVLMRTYQEQDGTEVMLALAFAAEQRQEIKVHQPEVCYPAQGYEIVSLQSHEFKFPSSLVPINGKRLIFKNGNRLEAVSYWIRVGDGYPKSGFDMRFKILKDGLQGKLDDGILVRASSIINQESEAQAAFAIQERFLGQLIDATEKEAPDLLIKS